MCLSDRASILHTYWNIFGPLSEYKAIIGGTITVPLVLSKDRQHVFGAIIRFQGSSGNFVLLPDIDFLEVPGLSTMKGGESCWTKKAAVLGQKFIEAIIGIDDALRSQSMRTPVPTWAKDRIFDLPVERKINEELLRLEQQEQSLQTKEAELKRKLSEESILKWLLYEQGKALEVAIIRALILLGFTASRFRDSDNEFDVVFESAEGRFIGEAEGKDAKPINIDKLRQLEMNIHEDYARDGVKEIAKAVLFGNAARLTIPSERKEFFTEKCLTAAKRIGCALVKTTDLFEVARYLSDDTNTAFAKQCREAILKACGEVVVFPSPPKPETEEHISTTKKTSTQ
jgi:hypothetical protein